MLRGLKVVVFDEVMGKISYEVPAEDCSWPHFCLYNVFNIISPSQCKYFNGIVIVGSHVCCLYQKMAGRFVAVWELWV